VNSRFSPTAFCHRILLFYLLVFGSWAGPVCAQTQPRDPLTGKNVLVLHAFESNVPVFELADRGIRAALDAGGVGIRNQFFEYLDLARNPGLHHARLMAELMRLRYGQRKIDAIITMYPEALHFALNEGLRIFPRVPIVALWMQEGVELPKTGRRIVQNIPKRDIAGTLEIALQLVPDAKRVYVVAGAYETDIGTENLARRAFKKWEDRLEFSYLSNMPLEEVLTKISGAPPGTIVLVLPFTMDVTGRIFTIKEVSQRVSRVSPAPVFGFYQILLGQGIVGGSLLNYEEVGARAGELALDILKGVTPPENLPDVLEVPHVPVFDWQQLRRWKLSESVLPKGSIVINRRLSFWDFKYHILGALVFIIGQSFLIAGLLVHRSRRRSAEDSLRRKTEELNRFFSVTLDLLCIANTDGGFLLLNPAWEKILGYTEEELRAKRLYDFIHPEDLMKTREVFPTLASQEKEVTFENRCRCKDGTYRWLEWTAVPVGNLIYAAARDVTERLKADAEARERREELAHVARIATMGEMTTSLAHEINQPLAAIRSNAEAAQRFLSQAAPDISEARQILDDIIRDDRRAGEVVHRVQSLVRKEKPIQDFLDLNKTIQEAVGLIGGEFLLHGLSITTELSQDLKMIRGDRVQLQQVILNLVLNSAAAMKNAPRAQRKIIVRTAMEDSGTVKASVTDFGTGIDENNIGRLFEPFYTTKPEGLGMGLSISQGIIKAHGGTMEASNNPDGGATFAFTLPAH
jgi:PAS domain S-box-containing protein